MVLDSSAQEYNRVLNVGSFQFGQYFNTNFVQNIWQYNPSFLEDEITEFIHTFGKTIKLNKDIEDPKWPMDDFQEMKSVSIGP